MSFTAGRQDRNLLVLYASWLSEPEHSQISELFAQQPRAFSQSRLWNHKQQNTAGPEPAIGVFQEDGFQSLVVIFPGFPVVRRIEVEHGHCFRLAPDIHGVRLQSLDSQCFRLFCPIGVDFNAVTMSCYVVKQVSERRSVADAGIERRESFGKSQPILQSPDLRYRKREKS